MLHQQNSQHRRHKPDFTPLTAFRLNHLLTESLTTTSKPIPHFTRSKHGSFDKSFFYKKYFPFKHSERQRNNSSSSSTNLPVPPVPKSVNQRSRRRKGHRHTIPIEDQLAALQYYERMDDAITFAHLQNDVRIQQARQAASKVPFTQPYVTESTVRPAYGSDTFISPFNDQATTISVHEWLNLMFLFNPLFLTFHQYLIILQIILILIQNFKIFFN